MSLLLSRTGGAPPAETYAPPPRRRVEWLAAPEQPPTRRLFAPPDPVATETYAPPPRRLWTPEPPPWERQPRRLFAPPAPLVVPDYAPGPRRLDQAIYGWTQSEPQPQQLRRQAGNYVAGAPATDPFPPTGPLGARAVRVAWSWQRGGRDAAEMQGLLGGGGVFPSGFYIIIVD